MTSLGATATRTMCEAFQATIVRDPDAVAVRTVGDTTTLTFAEWGAQVRAIAAGLATLGVRRGDTVALLMSNRPEFYPIDVAVQHLGAAPFSIYSTSSPEQVAYLLEDSKARVVVCERQYVQTLVTIGVSAELVCIDGNPDHTVSLDTVISRPDPDFDFEEVWRAVEPDDVLTLIYTSGTTGDPKGVPITHANMLAMMAGTERLWESDSDDRIMSFLPSAHIADRLSALYHLIVLGNQLTTVADRNDVAAALIDVQPTIFGAVPQIWQKLKAAVEGRIDEARGVEKLFINWAITVGRQASDSELNGVAVSSLLRAQHLVAEALVLSKLRSAIGLNTPKLAISAAAPLPEEVLRFFNGIGVPLSDAWGMSELSGVVTMSAKGHIRPGTVGQPLDGVEIMIADDGEVLVRGPMVMNGYLNKTEQTAATIDTEGWLHTGDIGELDDDGYLAIVDRKKELIINAGGKNMSPANIENWIKAFTPLIAQAVAIGNNRKYNVALIALDPDAVAATSRHRDLPTDPAELAGHPRIHAAVTDAVARANSKLSRVEQIKKFRIVPEFWEAGSDVLTSTLKIRRKQIERRYADVIEELYSDSRQRE